MGAARQSPGTPMLPARIRRSSPVTLPLRRVSLPSAGCASIRVWTRRSVRLIISSFSVLFMMRAVSRAECIGWIRACHRLAIRGRLEGSRSLPSSRPWQAGGLSSPRRYQFRSLILLHSYRRLLIFCLLREVRCRTWRRSAMGHTVGCADDQSGCIRCGRDAG